MPATNGTATTAAADAATKQAEAMRTLADWEPQGNFASLNEMFEMGMVTAADVVNGTVSDHAYRLMWERAVTSGELHSDARLRKAFVRAATYWLVDGKQPDVMHHVHALLALPSLDWEDATDLAQLACELRCADLANRVFARALDTVVPIAAPSGPCSGMSASDCHARGWGCVPCLLLLLRCATDALTPEPDMALAKRIADALHERGVPCFIPQLRMLLRGFGRTARVDIEAVARLAALYRGALNSAYNVPEPESAAVEAAAAAAAAAAKARSEEPSGACPHSREEPSPHTPAALAAGVVPPSAFDDGIASDIIFAALRTCGTDAEIARAMIDESIGDAVCEAATAGLWKRRLTLRHADKVNATMYGIDINLPLDVMPPAGWVPPPRTLYSFFFSSVRDLIARRDALPAESATHKHLTRRLEALQGFCARHESVACTMPLDVELEIRSRLPAEWAVKNLGPGATVREHRYATLSAVAVALMDPAVRAEGFKLKILTRDASLRADIDQLMVTYPHGLISYTDSFPPSYVAPPEESK